MSCEYTVHLIRGYQEEMLRGIWSQDGMPLTSNTINARVSCYTHFLLWMTDKGLRPSFQMPTVTRTFKRSVGTNAGAHITKKVEVRAGRLAAQERKLRMPSAEQISEWLKDVERRSGQAKALMCRTICDSALRRSETAGFRVNTVPLSRDDWHITNPTAPSHDQTVLIIIRYGAKGGEYGSANGDKIGPEAPIRIPLALAEAISEYRSKVRPHAIKKKLKGARTLKEQQKIRDETVHLFLDEKTGDRISGKAMYDAWTGAKLPFHGWCPHYGRDYWACTALLKQLEKHNHLLKLNELSHALVETSGISVIRFLIQPQLRHASEETCMIYLRWAMSQIGALPSLAYDAELDSSSDQAG